MKTLVLHARWFDHELRLRLSEETAAKIESDPIEAVNDDLDRARYGVSPRNLSVGQCRKVRNFFAPGNINYFDSAEIL